MSQDTLSQNETQKGQSLITVLLLGMVLALLAFALTKMMIQEMRTTAETKRKDLSFAAADAALQRAIAVMTLNDSDGLDAFNNITRLPEVNANVVAYFSLTATGREFTDIPNVKYWIKIVAGDRSDTTGAVVVANDTGVDALPNLGDYDLDRTIFVRVQHVPTLKEQIFYNVIHRNDVNHIPGGKGIEATDCIDTGSTWHGDTYDGCLGAYGGTNQSGAGGVVTPGEIQSSCIDSQSNFNLSQVNAAPNPSAPPAASIYATETNIHTLGAAPYGDLIGNTTVGTCWPAFWGGGAYRVDEMGRSGNYDQYLDVSRGPVHVYTTTANLGGNPYIHCFAPNASLFVDQFTSAADFSTSNTNHFYQKLVASGGYPAVPAFNKTSVTAAMGGPAATFYRVVTWTAATDVTGSLRIDFPSTSTANSPVFYTWLTTPAATTYWDARGYRNISITAWASGGNTTMDIGIVSLMCQTCTSEVTITTQVILGSLSLTAKKITMSFPTGVQINALRRIFVSNFNAGGSAGRVYLDDIGISRYGGSYCCMIEDCVVYVIGDNPVTLRGTGTYEALIYAPESVVEVGGGGSGAFSGAIIAKSFAVTGGGAGWFHYDKCLARSAAEQYNAPPVITTSWRQMRNK